MVKTERFNRKEGMMKYLFSRFVAAVVVSIWPSAALFADSVIDYSGIATSLSQYIPAKQVQIGQTFTTGADTHLTRFQFYGVAMPNAEFRIAEWTGSAPGALLFSAPASGSSALLGRAFDTGGLQLNPGAQYVAFFSIPSTFSFQTRLAADFNTGEDYYTGGRFVSSIAGGPWSEPIGQNQDMAFKATFSTVAVPVPSAALAGGGTLAMLVTASFMARRARLRKLAK